jgi:programmed cell death 6-interacting protein
MVKASVPAEIADAVSWLMKDSKGGPLFSGLVPYGVHLAISVYDDRKDTNVREVDNTREDLDGIAARCVLSRTR